MRTMHSFLKSKTHKFRKTLATYRRFNDVPVHISETLSNHAISSIEYRIYAQYPIEERRKDYDKYLPPEYKELTDFLEILV